MAKRLEMSLDEHHYRVFVKDITLRDIQLIPDEGQPLDEQLSFYLDALMVNRTEMMDDDSWEEMDILDLPILTARKMMLEVGRFLAQGMATLYEMKPTISASEDEGQQDEN